MHFSFHAILKETLLSGISNHHIQVTLSLAIITLSFGLLAYFLDKLIRQVCIRLLNELMLGSSSVFFAALADCRIFNVVSLISFAIVFDIGSSFVSFKGDDSYTQGYALLLQKMSYFIYYLVTTLIVVRIITTINTYYERKIDSAQQYPIYGYIKMAQFAVWCIAAILYTSFLLNKSPWTTLTGIGAISAFFLLIFKDTFLGLVSSIQATANQIVKLGDWVNIPKYNVDGEVSYISINIIKIRNWDNSVTTIPTFTLTSESIHNWQAMLNSQARRISRAVYIDVYSIQNCSDELLTALSDRYEFVAKWQSMQKDKTQIISNLGLYRLFFNDYLANNQLLNPAYTNLLRYLPPTPNGIPLQVYAFSRQVNLVEFEETQALIFEALFLSVPDFGLRFFQSQLCAQSN